MHLYLIELDTNGSQACWFIFFFLVQRCEEHLIEAIEKYDNDEDDGETENVFEDSLSTLVFELNQMLDNNTIGNGIFTTICFGFGKEQTGKISFKQDEVFKAPMVWQSIFSLIEL